MDVTLRQLNPERLDDIQAFYDVRSAARDRVTGQAPAATLAQVTADLQNPNPHYAPDILLASNADGCIVGCSQATMPQLKDRDMAWLMVFVPAEYAGQGIGSQLVEEALERLKNQQRTRILAEYAEPTGTTVSRSRSFAQRHGFHVCNVMVKMRLTWPRPPEGADAISSAVTDAAKYVVRHYEQAIPADHADALAALNDRVILDMPDTGFGWDTEPTTGADYANKFAHGVATGENPHVTALWHKNTCVALTKLIIHGDFISQATTVVAPEFRGQRLGVVVKEHALQRMKARFPHVRGAGTETSATNSYMIAVNHTLGYTSVHQMPGMRRDL